MIRKVLVHYAGWGERWQLGTLAHEGHDLLFEYSADALRQGLELSPRHLPLRPGVFTGFPAHQQHLPGLIADALPDGWGLASRSGPPQSGACAAPSKPIG